MNDITLCNSYIKYAFCSDCLRNPDITHPENWQSWKKPEIIQVQNPDVTAIETRCQDKLTVKK